MSHLTLVTSNGVRRLQQFERTPSPPSRTSIAGFTYRSRSETYRNSSGTCYLHVPTLRGYSYDWYRLVDTWQGEVILNTYNYSPTTIQHVYKMRRLLRHLGLTPIEIEAPKGLQNLDAAISYYEGKIADLRAEIYKPRSHKAKNMERLERIEEYAKAIDIVRELQS